MGRRSALTTHNKLVLYKQILKPVWTYGIQLWGCTKPSNIAIIQRFQNKGIWETGNPGDSVNFRSDVSYVWWQHYLIFDATWRKHDIIFT